jgi:UDP-N-acetylglucosamine:LPS N-acetylglucosamine transferase
MLRLAYFISPHGFGHAARAAAVMQALFKADSAVHFEIFTSVPCWFFQDSLTAPFSYHELLSDIGLVQKSAFEADLNATLHRLAEFLPFQPQRIKEISATVRKLNCAVIICDISPMGIAVARQAGIPALLVENFTWDWIYQQYVDLDSTGSFNAHMGYLQNLFTAVQYHIQTEPVCNPCPVDLTTTPVSREIKNPPDRIKKQLGLRTDSKMVLITTGGIKQEYKFLDQLKKLRNITFVLPGSGLQMETRDNLILLPEQSEFYHPDLVNASDAVVGKVGYSTLAEVYHAGVPFGYTPRSNFRESGPLVDFIDRQMNGVLVDESEFSSGKWRTKLENLLDMPRAQRSAPNGADQVGSFITGIIR